jgi:hypothetical protein
MLLDAKRLQLCEHVVEIAVRRLVGAYVLSRVDRVEIHGQLFVACGKALVVDVREDERITSLWCCFKY